MMRTIILFIFLAVVFSCHKEIAFPAADFEVPAGEIKAGVPATFKSISGNATSYEWDFGDASTIVTTSNAEITHNFKIHGTFTVKLIARNGDGSNGTTKSVKVEPSAVPLPKAIFELAPANECPAPCSVAITNNSLNATSYTWYFGDNTPVETRDKQPINRTFTETRNYAITLIAKASGLPNDTLTKTLRVVAPQSVQPVADFEISGDKCTANCDVTFNNKSTSGITYQWNFGDGILSADPSPKHNYKRAGSYPVILVTKNGNFTSTKKKIVQIYAGCKLIRHTRQHPISGFFEAIFQHDANDFPNGGTETEKDNSGAPVSNVVNAYTYSDGFINRRNYTVSARNNNQNIVEISSGNFTYRYNSDGFLIAAETLWTSVKDRNNPAGGSNVSRSIINYEYHANHIVSKVTIDGTVYNYSDAGLLTSVNPSGDNPGEAYTLKHQNFSKIYRVTRYIIANNRISEIEFTDNAKQTLEYDSEGQLIRKTFTDPALAFRTSCVEEWKYDNQKNIDLITPVFLGHPSYLAPEGVALHNVTSYTKEIYRAGGVDERQVYQVTSYSQYNEHGYPTKSTLLEGDNTYYYECKR